MRRHSCIRTLLQILTLAILPLEVSQAESDPRWETCHSACVAHSVTPGGRVRVIITRQKPRLYLAKSQRISLVLDDDNPDYYDELPDVQVGYRRPELVDPTAQVDDDLSDEIRLRLAIARIKALQAYDRNWA
jgi:hypothetical protein